jgi:hypothetical protein
VLLGIIWMYAVAVGHDAGTAAASHNDDADGVADQPCPGDGCGNHHTAFHACVSITSITAFAVGLMMLCRIGIGRAQHATSSCATAGWSVTRRHPGRCSPCLNCRCFGLTGILRRLMFF